ncbi:hypothetical protein MAR_008479 [Mya arenaria]|uniref:Uncharacterized protein n=1 Tax=Mya arenaria TaxID=6604 RepID=A0ABY7E0A3_MYAAR|nr:uncharacterized protein LOC128231783 [Mya arenaria]WAR01921.1 hypothetical protein MAR_008479 [Mya arenaria]
MEYWLICAFIVGAIFETARCSGSGGRCYSGSQLECEQVWTNLWNAEYERKYTVVCQHFTEVHKCTMSHQKSCPFTKLELELYEKDIVQYYVNKPHSCPLIGGNIEYRGTYGDDDTEKSASHRATGAHSLWTLFSVSLCVLLVLL